MKVLYLSFYFEPDLSAGSFRNSPLASKVAEKLKGQGEVHVVTTIPNRYQSFEVAAKRHEIVDNMTIDRIQIPRHKSGFFDQIASFRVFFFEALKLTKGNQYDLVFASSSRLFTAFLGSYLARRKKAPLYLDIRDIFRDTIKDVLQSKIIGILLLPVLSMVEAYTFNRAAKINLVSAGFKSYFSKFKTPEYSYYTNGIDDVFLDIENKEKSTDGDSKVVTYAGNIGESQGLHKIIPRLAENLTSYRFQIIGDGGAIDSLTSEVERLGLSNVDLVKPLKRAELIEYYKKSDFLFLHLNDYDAFKKVLPSKIFEYACFDQPMLAGVAGYAAEFVRDNVENSILFEPTDFESLIAQLQSYQYKRVNRESFKKKFSRKRITESLAEDVLTLHNV